MKPFYESKIIGLAVISILGAVSDGLTNSWGWRQYSVSAIGVALVVARAFYTDLSVGISPSPKVWK